MREPTVPPRTVRKVLLEEVASELRPEGLRGTSPADRGSSLHKGQSQSHSRNTKTVSVA